MLIGPSSLPPVADPFAAEFARLVNTLDAHVRAGRIDVAAGCELLDRVRAVGDVYAERVRIFSRDSVADAELMHQWMTAALDMERRHREHCHPAAVARAYGGSQ